MTTPYQAARAVLASAVPIGGAYYLDPAALFGLTQGREIAFVAFDFGKETILLPRKAISDPASNLGAARWGLSAFVSPERGLEYRFRERGRLRYYGTRHASAELAPTADTIRITFGECPEAAAKRLAEQSREALLRALLARVDDSEATGKAPLAAVLDGWTLATDGHCMVLMRGDLGPIPEDNQAPESYAGAFRSYLASFDSTELGACDLAKLPRALRGVRSAEETQIIAFKQGRRKALVRADLLARALGGLDYKAARVGLDAAKEGPVLFDGGAWRAIVMPMRERFVNDTQIKLWLDIS